jgi:hypothetical protein
MNETTVTLPTGWASALINGDTSGMDDAEIELMRETLAPYTRDGWRVVDVEDSDRFTWYYRLYIPLAECDGGNVSDYVLQQS